MALGRHQHRKCMAEWPSLLAIEPGGEDLGSQKVSRETQPPGTGTSSDRPNFSKPLVSFPLTVIGLELMQNATLAKKK